MSFLLGAKIINIESQKLLILIFVSKLKILSKANDTYTDEYGEINGFESTSITLVTLRVLKGRIKIIYCFKLFSNIIIFS